MRPDERDQRLIQILKEHCNKNVNNSKSNVFRILIFVLYKKEAPRVENLLSRYKYSCVGITGDKTQEQRNMAVEQVLYILYYSIVCKFFFSLM